MLYRHSVTNKFRSGYLFDFIQLLPNCWFTVRPHFCASTGPILWHLHFGGAARLPSGTRRRVCKYQLAALIVVFGPRRQINRASTQRSSQSVANTLRSVELYSSYKWVIFLFYLFVHLCTRFCHRLQLLALFLVSFHVGGRFKWQNLLEMPVLFVMKRWQTMGIF